MLAGKPGAAAHTLDAACCNTRRLAEVLLVLAPDDGYFDQYDWSTYSDKLVVARRVGGESRAASVRNGLRHLQADVADGDWVLVHDAARPCLALPELQRLIAEMLAHPVGGILAVPVADTLKRADSMQHIEATVPREQLWQAQTPQMFRYQQLLQALQDGPDADITDEASAIERLGLRPALVMGSRNIKLFTGDLPFAEWIHRSKGAVMRIGQGFDVHALVEGRRLIIGGVDIPFEKVCWDGHSDADVLLHAITDALIGAAALGDIGKHFPIPMRDLPVPIAGCYCARPGSCCMGGWLPGDECGCHNHCPSAEKWRRILRKWWPILPLILACGRRTNVSQDHRTLGIYRQGEGIAAEAVCLIEKTFECRCSVTLQPV